MPTAEAERNIADWFRGDFAEWRTWSATKKPREEYGEWRNLYFDDKLRRAREASLQTARSRRSDADREAGRAVDVRIQCDEMEAGSVYM